ncbi:hypothetical protein Krac_7092 [Ktedonobacter racemifer DSM 44963]|uniref:Uncharacterized protein n=1 Tax=Ktedonobacter racemifer DSM 44963 TaxID=485913 RepID=D6TQX2_KTERA|nr:hypothetical protein Krac_7092 [Ktedonobacter racemifer DSM 44963]
MHDAKTIVTSPRPVSALKYALLTALIIFVLRVILYVMMPQKAVFSYHSDMSLTFKTNDVVALTDTLILSFVNLLPFSYSKVCKTPLSGQLFLLHSRLPAHGNLWISPPVSVSHQLHRHFHVRS